MRFSFYYNPFLRLVVKKSCHIKLPNMSNVRNQNFVFLLYRLVKNFILRKNPKKKFSESYRLPLQSGYAGSPYFSKKTFFSYFSKTKSFYNFFLTNSFSLYKKVHYQKNFWLISIIYTDFGVILI